MYDESQLKRGILEGCILKVISVRETYGYEIINSLSEHGFKGLSEGTIYPLIKRIEKKGLIKYRYKPSSLGPKRKYFSITEEGMEMLESFNSCWERMSSTVNEILNLEVDDNE